MNERERMRAFLDKNPVFAEFLSERARAGKMMHPDDIAPEDELVIVATTHKPEDDTDSVEAKCGCGNPVWLSTSTDKLLKSRKGFPTRITCVACVVKEGIRP